MGILTSGRADALPRGSVVVTVVLALVVALVLGDAIIKPPPTLIAYSTPIVVTAACVLLVLIPVIWRICAFVGSALERMPSPARWALAMGGFALLTFIPATVGLAVRVPPGWDAGAVLETARQFAAHTHYDFAEEYFAWYPNNLFLAFALGQYFRALGTLGVDDSLAAAIWLHAAFMAASALLAFALARRLGGWASAVGTLLVSVPFVAFGPWSGIPYSDTLAMPFPIGVLLLAEAARLAPPTRSILLWAAVGIVAAVGTQVKPTVVFALVAVGMAALLSSRDRSLWRRTATLMVVALASAAGTFAMSSSVIKTAHVVQFDIDANSQSVPLTHFLKMGATGRGGFNADDVRTTLSTPPPERFADGMNGYLKRVEAMGPLGYPVFLVDKLAWSLGDGSFYAWAEGVTRENRAFPATDPLSQEIRHYYTFDGDGAVFMRSAWQAGWFAVLGLLVAAALARGEQARSWSGTTARLSILFLLAFLALFENRARYLYLYVPVFAVLAAAAADDVCAALPKVIRRGRWRATKVQALEPGGRFDGT